MIKAWHFTNGTLRDGEPAPPAGEWLRHGGEIIPCSSGLHASRRLIDALRYAPGGTLHRVSMRGEIIEHNGDKIVARQRRIEWSLSAEVMEPILRQFARWCALRVIHLWDAPEIVRRYLETGDELIRAAAWDAAGAAARAAAWAAAWAAAGDAAGDAARAAAGDAAWDAQEKELLRLVRAARREINERETLLPLQRAGGNRGGNDG